MAARRPRATAATGCPHADWVELDGVGHCPQLDVPLETAELILGFTARERARRAAERARAGVAARRGHRDLEQFGLVPGHRRARAGSASPA